MKKKELKALVSLLEDEDSDIISEIEEKIISLGNEVIPFLERQWESTLNPTLQTRIEDLIHSLQFETLKEKLIIWKGKKDKDLLKGLWLIATYQYPDLELGTLKKDIEQIYYEVWLEFKPEAHHYDQIKILNSVIFGKLKFSANTKNFHAPGNSMINVVLQSKKGNPISLCMIYMIIAQKLELPVYGVNLPNLFMLTYKTKDVQFYINVFNRGLIFSKSDIDSYLEDLQLSPRDIFYQPCENLEIIKRILRNLVVSFEKIGDYYKMEEIKILLNSIL
ncbi:MAG: transglutaminase-like domain-containing protein, partial [Bacteroidetes bacterium]|nr:transglutaminase-like domain-containing protein [Bacteroidota bacterium]